MKHIKSIIVFFISLILALSLGGCILFKQQTKTETEKSSNDGNGSGQPEYAEVRPDIINRSELTVVFSADDVELDFRKSFLASEAQIYTAIYEGLFSYHPFTMEPVPAAAEKWEVSEDKKQWTFTIRKNANFSNGDTVKAEDFRAAWISLLSPSLESPYSSLFDIIEGARDYRLGIEKKSANVGIQAVGQKTLVVKLNSPASFFPAMLCHHSFSPIHQSMIKKENWSATGSSGKWEAPVGNGPFFIESMDKNSIVMKKSSEYWDADRVSLKTLIIKFSEDADAASSLWNSGEARWISGDFNWDAIKDRSGLQVVPMFATHYYYIRSEHKPWNDYRVRKALLLALPWDELRAKHALPAKTLIFPLQGYPEIEGLSTTDIDSAKKLLAEAGFPGGKGLPELVIRLTPSPEAARIGGIMAERWKEDLGVQVKVEVFPYSQYFSSMKQSGYTVGSSTWIGDFADPYTFLQMWQSDSNLNDARHNDKDFEALIQKSMREEGEARLATLAEAEKLLLDRGSVIPISYSPSVNIIDTDEIGGWFPNALDIHPFKYLNFKGFKPLPGIALGVVSLPVGRQVTSD